MNNINYIGGDELVFNSDETGGINSGGFSVNSIMMKAGMSPIMTLNNQNGGGDKVSDLFNNLVIPNWALSYGSRMTGGKYDDIDDSDESDDEIDEDLHDKLLGLVRHHENEKVKKGGKKKTKKQKLNSKKGGTKKFK
jgi:hypothetical protein